VLTGALTGGLALKLISRQESGRTAISVTLSQGSLWYILGLMHFTWAYLAALPVVLWLLKGWLDGEFELLTVVLGSILLALPLIVLAQTLL